MPDNCCPPPFFLFSNSSQSLVNTAVRGFLCRENAGEKQRGRGDGRQQSPLLLFSFFSFSFSSGRGENRGVAGGQQVVSSLELFREKEEKRGR